MARPTEWRRGYVQNIDDTAETAFYYQIGAIAIGETLTRLRYTWQLSHVQEMYPAEAINQVVGLGIIDLDPDTDPSDFPYPLTNPDAEWIAYEQDFFLPYTVRSDALGPQELDLAPASWGERDSKAQRVSGPDGRYLWAIGETVPAQAIGYWSLAWSSLFLLPAT